MGFEVKTANQNNFWYLVQCRSGKEHYAANALKQLLNVQVYVPESEIRSRGIIKRSPFFPGYIFINTDLRRTPKSFINACIGVLRLVEFGDSPQAVPQCVIDAIVQQLSRSNELHVQSYQSFRFGDIVQIRNGPLQNLEMTFIGEITPGRRVRVLLELLGRMKEVQVDASILEKAPGRSKSFPTRTANESIQQVRDEAV